MSKVFTEECRDNKENKENKNNNSSFYRHLKNKPFTKYKMNDEDYNKRQDSIRKYRHILILESKESKNKNLEENKESLLEGDQFEIDLENCENYLRIFRIRREFEKKEVENSDVEIKVNNEINEFNSDEDEI